MSREKHKHLEQFAALHDYVDDAFGNFIKFKEVAVPELKRRGCVLKEHPTVQIGTSMSTARTHKTEFHIVFIATWKFTSGYALTTFTTIGPSTEHPQTTIPTNSRNFVNRQYAEDMKRQEILCHNKKEKFQLSTAQDWLSS